MRPYVKGENMSEIFISKLINPDEDMGMIARLPNIDQSQWYVPRLYFENNLEEVEGEKSAYN